MVFHARKWGWKRLVANLLLIPVLGGWSAGVAHAQFNPGPSPVTGNAPAIGMPSGEPKMLLKEGRKALAAGQFDRAQDLARSAEANNPTGKWGLFDDTPRSLMEDIQKAVAKHKKAQAEQCLKEAKSLLAKPGADAERIANLERAFQLCHQAETLHGPYSAWDFGERPDKLAKEIKAARERIQPAATTTTSVGMPGVNGQGTSAFAPSPGSMASSGGHPAAGATDPKKATATQLMNEARKLADQGMFGQARAKLSEADRVGAIFAPNEYTPTFAIQELNNRGAGAIERLVVEARSQMAKKDFARAEAALNGAAEIATALGLFSRPITEAREQLLAAAGRTSTPTPSFTPTGGPGSPTTPVGPGTVGPMTPVGQGPTNPPGIATVGGRPVAAPGSAVTGRQMLDQAVYEYSRGELEMATTLARQAYNLGGVKEEATSLLNSIDAERFAQKKVTAISSFEAAQAAAKNRDYNKAIGVLVLIDPNMLPPEARAKHAELLTECRTALAGNGSGVAVAGAVGTQTAMPPTAPPGMMPPGMNDPTSALPGTTPPGTAKIGDPKVPTGTGSADNVATQQDALRKVQFQKLRSEGLKIQADAQAAFGRGEARLAIQILMDYGNRVRASGLMAADIALLMRPIESRLDLFQVMAGQTERLTALNKESREVKEMLAGRNLADEQRHAEVAKLVKQYHELVKKNDFATAEKVAMQAKQLDPDDPALGALALMAKMHKRINEEKARKDAREELVYRGLGEAEDPGPYVTTDDPVAIKLERTRRAHLRGSLDDSMIRTRTPAEHQIELKLEKPITIDINQTPLDQAIDYLRDKADLPISIDSAAIETEGINLHKPVSEKLQTPVATKHVLAVLLEKGGLSYVVENDMVKVTTTKKAKGRLFTKVFSVADLVTPIPNFALPDYTNFEKMMNKNALNSGNVHIQGLTGTVPRMPAQGLNNGTMVGMTQAPGVNASSPGISGGLNFGPAGQLQTNNDAFASQQSPLGGSATLAGERNTKHEQLIKLITSMVRPFSWDGMGGPGRIEYFDIGSALVVNQVADVIQEVADLLEALRRLQDLAIAVEIRIVSLSETWYERMGVDFAMNILTHNNQFEPALTQVDPNTGLGGVFRPIPFINSNQFQGVTVGLTPAGNFTNDLGVPIAPGTFNMAVPPFGGFPNTPGQNGGISFGLAFLNDIQVYLLMEAAAGDRRVNVMQAPKLTLFNGQTATLAVTSTEFFVTNVTVVSVNGQLVFIPTNTPLAGPDTNFNIGIQAVVSADRRFVRLNLPVNLAAQTGATVPLFPITTFITPIFEGGSQGVPIPFTQFLQQPSFTSLNIQTTVVCPDGGTVLLGGLKTLQEGRNEFGPPFLSNIPYLNRLFKNVGIGRQTTHIMIMVTPRIIINSEEEIFQTEGRAPGQGP
jgi:type II secretory pathway component GspD/PulD (secretin)